MRFFRKRSGFRSLGAIVAAYAVILQAFFGGLVLSQHAGAATGPFVICYGLGGGPDGNGTTPVKQIPCSLCCAVHAAGTLPPVTASIGFVFSHGVAVPFAPAAVLTAAVERSPKTAQGPPFNV